MTKSKITATEIMLTASERMALLLFSQNKTMYLTNMFSIYGLEPISQKKYEEISDSLKKWELSIIKKYAKNKKGSKAKKN